ncbi:GNAT family N-acetyltransferase [Martelella lutilitoris]|uniref:GNAT family N-acetyltransferase n=1 Tax=Martelella lutilitoris TaxID=2583532 RepID=A0A7T7HP10_9HYPH|nr:GNAT family N-acetyltransferase [Martelella lutilitoris]QQM32578.1 GNAT family N-acetyltransferase [Martelella lutilitoris]
MDGLVIREAVPGDLEALIAIFAADDLGGHGDTTDPEAYGDYRAAFDAIAASANDTLYVAELDGMVVGTLQTSFTRTLTGRGSAMLTIEAVQTHPDRRGRGIGARMIAAAIAEARAKDCRLVQLMSNRSRTDAHRFYERLGFTPSHLGFKMKLKGA